MTAATLEALTVDPIIEGPILPEPVDVIATMQGVRCEIAEQRGGLSSFYPSRRTSGGPRNFEKLLD